MTKRTYKLNENYFKYINTEHKAYFLGFITADGNVYKTSLTIGLQRRDEYLLDLFLKSLKSNMPIYRHTNKLRSTNKDYEVSTLKLNSKKLIKDLSSYGIVARKSLNINIPSSLSPKYIKDYLRGIWDGDGTFVIVNRKDRLNTQTIRTSLCSGSYIFLENIQNILIDILGISKTKIIARKNSNVYYLQYGGDSQVYKIFNFLYKNCKICLNRKQNYVANYFSKKLG